MFEKRSKDGKRLWIVFYDYQKHCYCANQYKGKEIELKLSFFHDLFILIEVVKNSLDDYNADNPTDQRYHKLVSGDIWDNKTETIINYNALRDLLDILDNDDKKAISSALIELAK